MIPLSAVGLPKLTYFPWIILRSGSFVSEFSVLDRFCVVTPVPLQDELFGGEFDPWGIKRVNWERFDWEKGVAGVADRVLVVFPLVVDVGNCHHLSTRMSHHSLPESSLC